MLQLLRNTAGTIAVEFRDSAGALVDPSAVPPVAITDGAGTAVTSGTGTKVSVGQYSFVVLPTFTANLDKYTATWTPTIATVVNTYTTYYEVVGAWLYSVTDALNFNEMGLTPLADSSITAQNIMDTRLLVAERFETWCGTSFVPRGGRVTSDGTFYNPPKLVLYNPLTFQPVRRLRKINSLSVDGTAYDTATLADCHVLPASGAIQRQGGFFNWGIQNVSVWFEHGYDQPPEPIRRAALEYTRSLLVGNNQDERELTAAAEMSPGGLALPLANIPSRWRPTGLPRVDAVLWDHRDKTPGVA